MSASRITLSIETEDELAPEHREFRDAVTCARRTATATGVWDPRGVLVAVIMPTERVTREDAEARIAHTRKQAADPDAGKLAADPDVLTRIATLFSMLSGLTDAPGILSRRTEEIEEYLRHG